MVSGAPPDNASPRAARGQPPTPPSAGPGRPRATSGPPARSRTRA